MADPLAFIPGELPEHPGPLGRFLPPVPSGLAGNWLREYAPKGSWVLDPFGASPRLTIEAAQAGYRILAAVNNPITRFLLELNARPPPTGDLRAALADLAISFKGKERIEPHIRSLYETNCVSCGRIVVVNAFIWSKEINAPVSKLYNCPHCGDDQEHVVSQADVEKAEQFGVNPLHRLRALERVAARDDPDRDHAEEALNTYPARAVYALFTLINKLESLPEDRRDLVIVLLLAALDQSNSLWPYPTGRDRPRQLIAPTRYREKNVWLALEEAINAWDSHLKAPSLAQSTEIQQDIVICTWPELPPERGGICLYEGRLKDLALDIGHGQERQLKLQSVLTALPRPNQAFWTLSALWSGWLWGNEAAAPFKSVIRRRRYDWAWHCTALSANLKSLGGMLETNTPILALISEAEPGFLTAAYVAAELACFAVAGLAVRTEQGLALARWYTDTPAQTKKKTTTPLTKESILRKTQNAGKTYLKKRGSSANYIHLHAAALNELAGSRSLVSKDNITPADAFSQAHNLIQDGYAKPGAFTRYSPSTHSLEVGQWWLAEEDQERSSGELAQPLNDRIEMAVVSFLISHPGCSFHELDQELCRSFPDLLTPKTDFIRLCLESYGEGSSGRWIIRSHDAPKNRREDLVNIRNLVAQIGEELGYKVEGLAPTIDRSSVDQNEGSPITPLSWINNEGATAYAFYITVSAVFGKIVYRPHSKPGKMTQKFITIPGSRARLIRYKIRHDKRLDHQITKFNWNFVKFRHLRRLKTASGLKRNNLTEQFGLDPLENTDPQLMLF
ncbi:hypothetical protein ACFLZW_04090 [Chloroflexota bacterium]